MSRQRPMTLASRLAGALLAANVLAAEQGPELEPLGPLGPEASPIQLTSPGRERRDTTIQRPVDRERLVTDLNALLRSRDRVRRLLLAGEIQGIDPDAAAAEITIGERDWPTGSIAALEPSGPPLESRRLAAGDVLRIQPYTDGGAHITATIRNESLEVIYREIATMLGRALDDQRARHVRVNVPFHVRDLDWQIALERLLGQAGLAYEFDQDKLVIYDPARRPTEPLQLRVLAEQAFRDAGADLDDPNSAEGLFRLAEMHYRAGRLALAHEEFVNFIRDFDRADERFVNARPWLRKAQLQLGRVLTDMGQHREARQQYLRYISDAPRDDPNLATVYLAAALASSEVAASAEADQIDTASIDQARELLETLITRYASQSESLEQVQVARKELGRLFFQEGDYPAAKKYLDDFAEELGGQLGDDLAMLVADSDYELGLSARRLGNLADADRFLNDALTRYGELFDSYRAGQQESGVSERTYLHASFRIGLCWQQLPQPNYVRALFAFLRARQTFNSERLDPILMVHMARCYAELEADEQAHAELFNFLRSDFDEDSRPPDQQLAQLLEDLKSGLAGYRGSERHKILFYIAQGQYRAAERDPVNGAARMASVVHTYQRLVGDNADMEGVEPDIAIAARLGLARAAFKAGDLQQAERVLTDLIRDDNPDVSNQDRAMAASMLADHYRDRGRFDRALEIYQASLERMDQ